MHVAEKDVLHEMVKIVKKKVRMFLEYFSCSQMLFLLFTLNLYNLFIVFLIYIVARLPCQRENIDPDRYLARSIWRTKGKISTILCCIPRFVGMST